MIHRPRFLLVALVVLTTSSVAFAQEATSRLSAGIDPEDAVNSTTDVEGRGIRVGEGTVLHPVVGMETGYISNVFYTENQAAPAGLFRIMGEMDVSSLPAARLAENDQKAQGDDVQEPHDLGVFEYDASAHLSYDRYLSGNDAVTAQGGVGGGVLFDGVVNPDKPLVFGIFDNYNRFLRPPNYETDVNTNRDINILKLHLLYRPFGRSVSGMIHYTNTIDAFEDETQRFANRFQNSIGLRVFWQALPRTRIFVDVTQGLYTGLGDSSTKVTSYPLTATTVIQTALSVNSTFVGRIGYTNGFYASGPSYSSVVGGVQLGYRFNDLSRITGVFSYDHEDSINANFYRDFLFGLHYEYRLPPFVVVTGPELRLRQYDGIMSGGVEVNGPDVRNDVIFAIPTELRYNFRDWFAVSLEYNFTTVQTDYRYTTDGVVTDPSYLRHSVLLGVRAAL